MMMLVASWTMTHITKGIYLILPKKHVRYFDELDENTANSIMKAETPQKIIKELFNPQRYYYLSKWR